ncbi:MAG: AcrB/AcrD/AcrF family multidrug efflux protein [Bryobacterales bacterium]|nr:AcrB/AcrD/AcrF family multidrug efflux protein [Bryobacterales bacterium]
MWIVKLALRRPYTFVVGALLVLVLGIVTILRMPVDIFPYIDIPVVSVIWQYSGLAPEEMERRIVTIAERSMTTTVNDIEHIESQSLYGVAVIKLFFQPGVHIEAAVAQITANCQSVTHILPLGITPPLVVQYNVSNVPILQASLGGKGFSEAELYDFGLNFIRTGLANVQGASIPTPYGGKPRQIMVDLEPDQMFSKGISPSEVSTAINEGSVILPGGSAKFGEREYRVRMNNTPEVLEELNNLPIKLVNGTPVYIRDVAQVRDGYAIQTNMVREDGRRAALLTILRNGNASTLEVVERIKKALPAVMATLPLGLNLKLLFDQSLFVRAAIDGVLREGTIAACLTAMMILLFLGSWRSTLIVSVSIPLSILVSIIVMRFLGQTLNVMTLGGLALAVGILVDDATVEIENIHRNMGEGKPILQAILDGAEQIAIPAFVSTLSICIVFVPVVFLNGAAKSLFTPLAMAVVFAMLASYLLSRTIVPTMAKYLLAGEAYLHAPGHERERPRSWFGKLHAAFERGFERMRESYRGLLLWALAHRLATVGLFGLFSLASLGVVPFLGQDFFPSVDAGQFRLHVRAPPGSRIEETARILNQVEDLIKQTVPPRELTMVLDNIGVPQGGSNIAFGDPSMVGPADAEILVSLNKEHAPTAGYVKLLRASLRRKFPQLVCFFQPSDIVSQILNFGLPAPIDIQVVGRNLETNYKLAEQIRRQVERIPGAADVHVHQVVNAPEIRLNVDRTRGVLLGMSERQVANNMMISLSSSGQTTPNYWLNPKNGVSYLVAVQTPEYKMSSIDDLQSTPLTSLTQANPQMLTNLTTVQRINSPAVVSHYSVQPTYDIYCTTQGRDLGGVAGDIDRVLNGIKPPRGTTLVMRGQVESMRSSFIGLGFGLLFAILLVYFLMVVNFQSWLDPLIIMMALPGALSGILFMLFITQTTLSVPSLMGAIMSVGVATANSILLVTFANDQRIIEDATGAALAAGYTRLRPVLMTALAMIIGMLPMALGFGEGGEQNAPLGRAVIGGLAAATFATLFLVPVIYATLRRRAPFEEEAI